MAGALFRQADLSRPASSLSLVDELGAYEALWADNDQTFAKIAALLRDKRNHISDLVDHALAEPFAAEVIRRLRAANLPSYGIVLYGAANYPSKLRDAKNPVELLYYSGCWSYVETKCISIVGSREATEKGRKIARQMAAGMVADGYTVVSGLAKGIDTEVHESVLEQGGRTIAVIGTPLTETYPRENTDLQRHLAEFHLVISQVPIHRYYQQDWRMNRFFFPERNITMSALSLATVIVEASDTSGTLTQAQAALAQGRQLFILDNCFRRTDLAWPTKFLEKGAIRVGDYEEVKARLNGEATRN